MPGGGDFVWFFRPGGRRFALKAVPGAGILMEKISGPAVSPGGMVTGQIDTCISPRFETDFYFAEIYKRTILISQ